MTQDIATDDQPATAYYEELDWQSEYQIEEDDLASLLTRLRIVEGEISHHNFALFHPAGHINRRTKQSNNAHRFFTSVALGCSVFVLGCTIAASISVDAKQRGELSTAVAATSAVAAWAVTMMGIVKEPEKSASSRSDRT